MDTKDEIVVVEPDSLLGKYRHFSVAHSDHFVSFVAILLILCSFDTLFKVKAWGLGAAVLFVLAGLMNFYALLSKITAMILFSKCSCGCRIQTSKINPPVFWKGFYLFASCAFLLVLLVWFRWSGNSALVISVVTTGIFIFGVYLAFSANFGRIKKAAILARILASPQGIEESMSLQKADDSKLLEVATEINEFRVLDRKTQLELEDLLRETEGS